MKRTHNYDSDYHSTNIDQIMLERHRADDVDSCIGNRSLTHEKTVDRLVLRA